MYVYILLNKRFEFFEKDPLPTPAEPLENENTDDQILITDDDYSSQAEPKKKDNIG